MKTQIDRQGHFDTDHVRVSAPMRRADWPVARSVTLLQTQTVCKFNP